MRGDDEVTREDDTQPTRAARRAAREADRQQDLLVVLPPMATVPRPVSVIVTGAGGLVTALGLWSGQSWITAAAMVLLGLLVVQGWHRLLGAPSRHGGRIVLAVAMAALTIAVIAGAPTTTLDHVPVALALSTLAAFVHQLVRRDGRARLSESIAISVFGVAVLTSGLVLVVTAGTSVAGLAAAGMVAVAVGAVADLFVDRPVFERWLLPLTMVGGALVAALVDAVTSPSHLWAAVLLGMLGAMIGHLVRRVLAVLPAISSRGGQAAAGAASVLAPGMVIHVVALLLGT